MKIKIFFHEVEIGQRFWYNGIEYKKIVDVFYDLTDANVKQTNKENAIDCVHLLLSHFLNGQIVFIEENEHNRHKEIYQEIKNKLFEIKTIVNNFELEG